MKCRDQCTKDFRWKLHITVSALDTPSSIQWNVLQHSSTKSHCRKTYVQSLLRQSWFADKGNTTYSVMYFSTNGFETTNDKLYKCVECLQWAAKCQSSCSLHACLSRLVLSSVYPWLLVDVSATWLNSSEAFLRYCVYENRTDGQNCVTYLPVMWK